MKRYICLLIIMISVVGLKQSHAQSNAFKINILSPMVRTVSVFYERKVSTNSSFQLGFFYTGYSPGSTNFNGYGITPEYRFYLSEKDAIQGFYVAPFVRYSSFNLTDDTSTDEATLTTIGGGLLVGHQWVFKQRVTLDVFVGPKYMNGDLSGNTSNEDFNINLFEGFGLRTGLTLGVAF